MKILPSSVKHKYVKNYKVVFHKSEICCKHIDRHQFLKGKYSSFIELHSFNSCHGYLLRF